MKRSKWLILCLVVCMAASLGGTIAYLTDADGDVNVMTLGNVNIELIEQQRDGNGGLQDFEMDQTMLPVVGEIKGDGSYGMPDNPNFIDKIVRVQCTSRTANAYLRVYVGLPSALRNVDSTGQDALHMLTGEGINLPGSHTDTWAWKSMGITQTNIDGIPFDMHCFEYQKLLEPGELTPPVLAGLWLDSRLDSDNNEPFRYVMTLNGTIFPLDYDFSINLQVPVLVQATQADGFDSAQAAFQASGMNNPDFDTLLNLNIGSSGPGGNGPIGSLGEFFSYLETLLKAEDNGSPSIEMDASLLSDESFFTKLHAISNTSDASYTLVPVSDTPDEPIMINLNNKFIPENATLTVPTGQPMVIIGDESN